MTSIRPTHPPIWWNLQLEHTAITVAERAYPNEVGGFFWSQSAGSPALHVLDARATPSSFMAYPQSVVSFLYEMLATEQGVILATFHSHPMGQWSFSEDDVTLLRDWAQVHVLAVKANQAWHVRFGQSD